MINLGAGHFTTNALFLQPTFDCGKNCSGCYVKAHEELYGRTQMSQRVWRDIIWDVLVNHQRIAPTQVTLALDTISRSPDEGKFMRDLARSYFNGALEKNPDMEVHFTVNCVNDLRGYLETYKNKIEGINLVSISNLNKVEDIEFVREWVPGARVNWNVLSSSLKNRDPVKDIRPLLQRVDMMYLLLHKAPMGQEGHDLASFHQAVKNLLQLDTSREPTPAGSCAVPSLTTKVVTDGCLADSRKFLKTGFGCSSNVNRFQVWPDGRVTGCAYNSHNRYGKAAESLEDIVANLKDARDRYEFKACSIPKAVTEYDESRKRLPVVG